MTNANSFHSALFTLLLFGVIYFVALGIYSLKKFISGLLDKKRDEKEDSIC